MNLMQRMSHLIDKLNGFLRAPATKGVVGVWDDEHQVVKAALAFSKKGYKNFETISPFPLHGIDEAMNIPRSFIPWATFVLGICGCAFGVWFTWWTSAVDWPLNIGGKPLWSLPAFIPIIFELVILFAALGSVATLLYVIGLPKVDPPVIKDTLSSHQFAIFIPEKEVKNKDEVYRIFKEFQSVEQKDGVEF